VNQNNTKNAVGLSNAGGLTTEGFTRPCGYLVQLSQPLLEGFQI